MRTAILAVSLLAATALGQDAPLTQADAVDAALSSQPSLRAAQARVDAAAAREEQARLGRFGSLSTSLAWTPLQRGQRIDVPGFGGTEPETFEMRQTERFALGVSLSQPLWTWGALSGQLRSAQEEREAIRLESDRAREQVVFEVTRAFATAVATGEAEEVARRDRAQREELLRVARSRVEAASAAPLDALQAEVALAEAESALLQAANRRRLAREALVTLTVDKRFRTALLAPPPDPDGPLPAEDEAVAAARAGRSDLASLRALVGSLGAGAAASRASGMPSLALQATLTQQHESATRLLATEGRLYQVGLAVSWDPVGRARARTRARELESLARAQREALAAAEQNAELQVREALATAAEALERVRVQRRALALAGEQVRIALLAYSEGLITQVEAREAQLALTSAGLGLSRARLDAVIARAALRLALGPGAAPVSLPLPFPSK
jgi:outer membrane protein TolC